MIYLFVALFFTVSVILFVSVANSKVRKWSAARVLLPTIVFIASLIGLIIGLCVMTAINQTVHVCADGGLEALACALSYVYLSALIGFISGFIISFTLVLIKRKRLIPYAQRTKWVFVVIGILMLGVTAILVQQSYAAMLREKTIEEYRLEPQPSDLQL